MRTDPSYSTLETPLKTTESRNEIPPKWNRMNATNMAQNTSHKPLITHTINSHYKTSYPEIYAISQKIHTPCISNIQRPQYTDTPPTRKRNLLPTGIFTAPVRPSFVHRRSQEWDFEIFILNRCFFVGCVFDILDSVHAFDVVLAHHVVEI